MPYSTLVLRAREKTWNITIFTASAVSWHIDQQAIGTDDAHHQLWVGDNKLISFTILPVSQKVSLAFTGRRELVPQEQEITYRLQEKPFRHPILLEGDAVIVYQENLKLVDIYTESDLFKIFTQGKVGVSITNQHALDGYRAWRGRMAPEYLSWIAEDVHNEITYITEQRHKGGEVVSQAPRPEIALGETWTFEQPLPFSPTSHKVRIVGIGRFPVRENHFSGVIVEDERVGECILPLFMFHYGKKIR